MQPHIYQPPMDPYLDILYRDEQIIVLNKPSGLLSVPGRLETHRDSLATRVQEQFPKARVVHRLDMATSGVMVMAMNADVHRNLSRQFEQRQVIKSYYAWVWGEVNSASGEVDLPLICDWPNRPLQKVDYEVGKPALTRWQKVGSESGNTLVKLFPETGRSHQLRVHMLAIGHPILGDDFYAHPDAKAAASHLQLHAAELGFYHPDTASQVQFSAPAPFQIL